MSSRYWFCWKATDRHWNWGNWNKHKRQQLEAEIIKQCILNAKIFAKVQVAVNKPLIDVVLEERWTLLPLPYVYSNGDDYSSGLFILESNLFGLGKKELEVASLRMEAHISFIILIHQFNFQTGPTPSKLATKFWNLCWNMTTKNIIPMKWRNFPTIWI